MRIDDVVIGAQSLRANNFPVIRTVGTGSWLTLAHQGKGYGTEMRAAVLLFPFDTLHALRAETGAFADNPASIAVTTRLGYRRNGSNMLARRKGEAAQNLRFVLDAADLRRPDWRLQMDGASDEVLTLLGAIPAEPTPEPVADPAGG